MKAVRFSIPVLLLCCWIICFTFGTVEAQAQPANKVVNEPVKPAQPPKEDKPAKPVKKAAKPVKRAKSTKPEDEPVKPLKPAKPAVKKVKEAEPVKPDLIQTKIGELEKLVKDLKDQLGKNDEKQQELLAKVKELEDKVTKYDKILPSLLDQAARQVPPIPKGEIRRTCAEIHATDVSIPSGMQWIDPDGYNVGEIPIYVYCNMTTGSTTIKHDSDSPINVGHCAEAGCYSRSINYEVPLAQIKALADWSSECQQPIAYDCFYAPYKFGEIVYSWWNDRDGVSQYFWAGNNAGGTHTCQCGINGNCVDSSVMCNCDSLAPKQLTDSGIITNKNILPITRLNFGRTQLPTSSGIHKLGNLTCSGYSRQPEQPTKTPGQVKPATAMPTSCNDLKKMGYTLSGFFSIKGPKMMESVYCDFSKLPNDPGFQKLIGYIDVKSAPTYFYVQRNSKFGKINTPITFHSAIVNAGNAMNLLSGKFKALVKGTYFFSFAGLAFSPGCTTACSLSHNAKNDFGLQVSLYLNGERIGFGSVQDSNVVANQWSPVSFQATLNLKKGDTVWVQISYLSTGAYLHDDNFHHTHFTGFMLEEEIVDSL